MFQRDGILDHVLQLGPATPEHDPSGRTIAAFVHGGLLPRLRRAAQSRRATFFAHRLPGGAARSVSAGRRRFARRVCDLVAIPLYGGLWAMACASTSLDPTRLLAADVERRLELRRILDLKYYNGGTHRGMLALPNFVRTLLS